jgi:SAM-dependent methyltransferase
VIWRSTFLTLREVVPAPLKDLYRCFVPRSMKETFCDIYLLNSWGSGSGIGSTQENTGPYREFVQEFLRWHKIRSAVDLGCGDWNFSRLIDWSGVRYTGIDVVPEVIAANRQAFGSRGEFKCLDFSREELPPADLALVKDVLQHWPNDAIRSFMGRLQQFRYALITNCCYEHSTLNADIGIGGFRPLDLRREPFGYDLEEVLRFRTEGVPVAGENKQVLLLRGKR